MNSEPQNKTNSGPASNKTICLNMIVKNEAHIITETFDNILKYIPLTYWVISDTGSTDGTQEVIKDYFKSKNIGGELFQDEWRDFGHNRTLAL
jgi:glycosyltransferase involved in cell wall biosynthesis